MLFVSRDPPASTYTHIYLNRASRAAASLEEQSRSKRFCEGDGLLQSARGYEGCRTLQPKRLLHPQEGARGEKTCRDADDFSCSSVTGEWLHYPSVDVSRREESSSSNGGSANAIFVRVCNHAPPHPPTPHPLLIFFCHMWPRTANENRLCHEIAAPHHNR